MRRFNLLLLQLVALAAKKLAKADRSRVADLLLLREVQTALEGPYSRST